MMARAEQITSPSQQRAALATICGILFLTFLDTTIMSVALADVQDTLHAGVTELQWVVNGYALVFASLMLGAGTLGDRLGRKRVMLAGVCIFCAGSLFGALAPNTAALIAARGLMGVGAAACEPGTLSIVRHLYPERRTRARALGAWAAIAGLALAMGPVIGGPLVGVGGWRAIFWFNLGAGLLALAAATRRVPESLDPQPVRFDILGFVLGPTALGTLIFAVIRGETAGYLSRGVLTLFAVAVLAGVLFVLAELRSPAPILDMRYMRRPAFAGALSVAFATYFGIFSIFFLTALYLQIVEGYSAYKTAAAFAPMAAAMISASAFAGPWVGRSGARLPIAVGCTAGGLGVLLTDWVMAGDISFAVVALTLTLAGAGFGIAVVPVTSVALSEVPAQHSGMAASATTTSREVGSVLGVAVLGALFNGKLTSDLTERLTELGVPAPFQSVVIDAVKTGGVPKGGEGAAGAEAVYGGVVTKVIDAAYAAFHTGLSVSLIVAGSVILASGLLALVVFGRPSAGD